MKKQMILFLLLFRTFAAVSQYQFNENCKEGWQLLMDLRITEAKQLMEKELAVRPTNYYALYLEQTCDAYALYINSDKKDYERFIDNYSRRREIMDGQFRDSPYYLMCKSEMDLQAGMFQVLNGSMFGGIRKLYTGYNRLHKNLDRYPGFQPSRMLDGFFNCALSNLPPFVKNAVSVFSVSSDFEKGWKTLNEVCQAQKNIRGINAEAALFITFVAKINKTPEMAYDLVRSYDPGIDTLFLPGFFKANIEYSTGRNEQALKSLSLLKDKSSPYAGFLYDYLMGKCLLRKLDPAAEKYIEKFLSELKKEDYFREMTYNLALLHLIRGDRNKYQELCRVVREKGKDLVERDHEALYDASLDYEPDISLVKARLLLAGGYTDRFRKTIRTYEQHPRRQLPYLLEYDLLMGKYYETLGQTREAAMHFQQVISRGREADYSFASEAALRLGGIREKEKKYDQAKKYYRLASDLYKNRYYEYIGSKAEKGLARVGALTEE